jgi:tetratricopeptide (TPR) repeat protein
MDGKIDEALEVLDEARLETEEKKSADARILKAQLLELNNDFEGAEANYLKAVDIFPSFDNNLSLANFYQKLNRFQDAEIFYNKCLSAAKSPDERATTLNNLGLLQANRNEQEKAAKAYTEALEIYRQLAKDNSQTYLYIQFVKDNSQTYLPDVAMTLNNLGALHAKRNEQEKAEAAYTEALEIYRQFAKDNPQTYLPDVATTLINLSIFYQNNLPDKKLSLKYVTEAIECLLPFQEIPDIQRSLETARAVKKKWK